MASFYRDPQQVYRVKELERLEWLEHGFGTRASGGWVAGELVTLRQIHSDICVCAGASTSSMPVGDALVSNTPGRFLGIRTADCLPILMVDERRRAIAAVHAGWRGTARRIAPKVLETLAARFASRPEDLLVAIGPGICGCCYTVGPEVARQFHPWFPELAQVSGQTNLDLAEANRRQIVEAGVPAGRIYTAGHCSFCQPEDFFSYRRDPHKPGRMLSAIGFAGDWLST